MFAPLLHKGTGVTVRVTGDDGRYAEFRISGMEIIQNATPERICNLIEARIEMGVREPVFEPNA